MLNGTQPSAQDLSPLTVVGADARSYKYSYVGQPYTVIYQGTCLTISPYT